MIECFNYANAHALGPVLPQMFELRKRIFIDGEGYTVTSWQGMEFDRYDTPAAWYGLWRDDAGVARGVMRLNPTTLPYMISDLWPDAVAKMPLPKAAEIWEATRCGIDPALPKDLRQQVTSELMLAYQELGLALGAKAFVAVSEPRVWDRMGFRKGWPLEALGPVIEYDGWNLMAVLMPVSSAVLDNMRKVTGISNSVLQVPIENAKRMAAE